MAETMLKKAIESSGLPPKAIAAECNYSVDAIYAASQGKRRIPWEARRKISKINILGGLAVAHDATGYNCFEYIDGDRHPQTMIRRVEKEDAEADAAIKPLGWRLIDKNKPEDLTPEDEAVIDLVGKEVSERIKADLNLLITLDTQYKRNLVERFLLSEKEKGLGIVAESRASYKTS